MGFSSAIERFHEITQSGLHQRIAKLANDPAVDGILLQLPLPDGLDSDQALEQIPPHKDVDGLHPYNAGRLAQGNPTFIPATPLGVLELLRREQIDPTGQRAVVVGRSRLVGRPVSLLLLQNHATVTIAHSHTIDLPAITRTADWKSALGGLPIEVEISDARGNVVRRDAIKLSADAFDEVAFTTQPTAQTLTAGATATFTVAAAGTAPLSYQWQKAGVDIPGATSQSYTTAALKSTADRILNLAPLVLGEVDSCPRCQ